MYFDIPNTLISLFAYVEYKIESEENSSIEFKKKELIRHGKNNCRNKRKD